MRHPGPLLVFAVLAALIAAPAQKATAEATPSAEPPPPVEAPTTPAKIHRPNVGLNKALQADVVGRGRAPISFEGRVVDESGHPLPDVEVRVDASASHQAMAGTESHEAVEALHLGTETTGKDGKFRLRIPFATSWSGYQEPDGTIAVTVSSISTARRGILHATVRPPSGPGDPWTLDVDGEGADADNPSVTAGKAEGLREITLTAAATGAADGTDVGGTGGFTTMGVDGYEACGGTSFYYWSRSDANVIRRYLKVARSHTLNQLYMRYAWSNSKTTEMEFIANVGYKGALATVGYGKSQTHSSGATYKVGPYRWIDFLAEWDFRAYNLYCGSGSTYSYSGIYEWRPYVWTGGTGVADVSGTLFACQASRTTQIAVETWAARSGRVFWSNSFSIGGVGARSRQTNDTEHKAYWTPTSTTSWCGDNDYPIYANLVREA